MAGRAPRAAPAAARLDPWTSFADVPRRFRKKLDHLIDELAEANKNEQYADNDSRTMFIDGHVFKGWRTNSFIPKALANIPERAGDHWTTKCGHISGEPVYVKPTVKADTEYPSFMYVNSRHSTVVSSRLCCYTLWSWFS